MVKQGTIIKVSFDPQNGSEQAGDRPAIIVSNERLNRVSRVVLVCPITNTERQYPTHVKLARNMISTGEIMCEQLRALDLGARKYAVVEEAPKEIVEEVAEVLGYITEVI